MNKSKMLSRALVLSIATILIATSILSCDPFADKGTVVRSNLEHDEQNFKVYRRVVFYNGITDSYILTVEGYLAVTVDSDGDLVVTVKKEDGTYLKHYLGLSDNVTYFSEALASNDVSDARYKVVFKPSAIIPTLETQTNENK